MPVVAVWMGLGALLMVVLLVVLFVSGMVYIANTQRPYPGQVRRRRWG